MAKVHHPDPDALLGCSLGEGSDPDRAVTAAHAAACAACREALGRMNDVLGALGEWSDEAPPPGGLERVLASTAASPRTVGHGGAWIAPVLPSLAGVACGGLAISAMALRVLAVPAIAESTLAAPLKALSGLGIASVLFFGAGSLLTLALAPMLILDLQRQVRRGARRSLQPSLEEVALE